MSDVIIPDLVVGGAPKSGTTSLFMWMSESPEVIPSSKKETNFLLDRESWLFNSDSYLNKGVDGYTRFFGERKSGQLLMEGCAVYLYSETARKFFSNKNTKVVFVLRNPVERVKSNYNYFFKVNQSDKDITYEEYIDALLNGELISENEQVSQALEHGNYALYLQRWYEDLGKDRVKVVLLDDLKANPDSVVKDICEWTGISTDFVDSLVFNVDNASYAAKSKVFHVVARFLSGLLPDGKLRNKIKNFYISINGKRSNEESPNAKLVSHYREKNMELEQLLSRDLAFWEN